MTEPNSGFFTPQEAPRQEARLELLHASGAGFCDIYRIDRMGRFRVLKCLKPEYRGKPLYEDLLRKDFEIGYSLRHPGIVEYYAFPQVEGLGNCIEMDWIDGRTLAEFTARGNVTKEQEERILDELCDALSYLHSRQVVHRDLKPSNILLTYAGDHVRLIDFGFSDSSSHSLLKSPAGTACYSAPEVLKGRPADARSDIYSLGLVIRSLSSRYGKVARKCCYKDPQRRYASVAQVKEALHSRFPFWLFALAAAAVAAVLLIPRLHQPGRTPAGGPAAEAPADTAVAIPIAPTPAESPAAAPPPAQQNATPSQTKKVAVDTSLIDDLFRQATDLFD